MTRFFTRYFSSAEDLAAGLFLLGVPISLLFTLFVEDVWDKHGIRVQAFCVSALLSMAVIAFSGRARSRFSAWLISTSVMRILVPLWACWIIFSVLFYGFISYDEFQMGFLSVLLTALGIPYLCYVLPRLRERWIKKLLVILIYVILIIELIFLAMHSALGVSHNILGFLDKSLLRVFMNTRDGGVWAVGASVVALSVYLRKASGSMMLDGFRFEILEFDYCLMLIPCWSLGLLTSGRGVLLSLLTGLIVIRLAIKVNTLWLRIVASNILSFLIAFVLNAMIFGSGAGQVVNVASKFARKDVGRLSLWAGWLRSFVESPSSIAFGKGFNYFPVDHINTSFARIPHNPHNLYIQVIHDTGLLGIGVIAFSLFLVVRSLSPRRLNDPELVYGLSCFAVCTSTAAVFDWPAGSWFCCLIPLLIVFEPSGERVAKSGVSYVNRVVLGLFRLSPWLFLFAFMVLQIPFVAARHVVFIPEWMLSNSAFLNTIPSN